MAEGCRVGERSSLSTSLPDSAVSPPPLPPGSPHQGLEMLPELCVNVATLRSPLVGAIDYFTKDIVLPLLNCGISPPDRSRSAVAFQFRVFFLWCRQVPIQVVEDMGSSFSGYGIQNPAQEASSLVGHADAPQCISRIGGISNP